MQSSHRRTTLAGVAAEGRVAGPELLKEEATRPSTMPCWKGGGGGGGVAMEDFMKEVWNKNDQAPS